MKKVISTLLFTLVIGFLGYAQNFIYHGDKQYASTNTWEFVLNSHYWTGEPEFTIAKNSTGGYLMISIEVPFKSEYIGGSVIVFLSDGSMIKCGDKGVRDHVDNKSIALYNFNKLEIEKLKLYRITKIRFSIMGSSLGAQTFTADNKESFSYSFDGSKKKDYKYDTNIEISELFD